MASLAALKKQLKARGMPQTGEKKELQRRVELYDLGEVHRMPDGRNPAIIPAAEFRKALATRGLPCDLSIESKDELLDRLVQALKANSTTSGGGVAAPAAADGGSDDISLAVEVARQVLMLGEGGDYDALLSLAGSPVSRSTPFAQLRKAYLNLARLIHPDKLSGAFKEATRAFQELVRAFESLSSPEPPPQEKGAAGKRAKAAGPAIARSNANCFRTRLFCPRCSAEWATADSGVEKFEYNFMMQGIKTFFCARCLCDFGCVTASHRCPLCSKPFIYHPNDYHRQVRCGNSKCSGEFGFWLYPVPPRVEAAVREELKQQQEAKLKAREASLARLQRAQRKQPTWSAEGARKQAEALFVRGLVDSCPRCGFEPPAGATDGDSLRLHLSECTDKRRHEAHRRAVQEAERSKSVKRSREEAQHEAQNLAAWQYLGGSTESMWLLTDKQLRKQCEERGIAVDGKGRDDLLGELAAATSTRLLTDKAGEPGRQPSAGISHGLTRDSLPSNLHSMSLSQLRSICAAHGLKPKGNNADEVIKGIEAALYEKDEPLLLE